MAKIDPKPLDWDMFFGAGSYFVPVECLPLLRLLPRDMQDQLIGQQPEAVRAVLLRGLRRLTTSAEPS